MSRWLRLSLVGLMVVVGMSLITIQAQADSAPTGFQPAYHLLQNGGTGQCLDGAAEGSRVYTSPCTTRDRGQLWQVWNGKLTNIQSQRCLDHNFNGSAYTSLCSPLDDGQHWRVTEATLHGRNVRGFTPTTQPERWLQSDGSRGVYTGSYRPNAMWVG